jgi:hypothetical protein
MFNLSLWMRTNNDFASRLSNTTAVINIYLLLLRPIISSMPSDFSHPLLLSVPPMSFHKEKARLSLFGNPPPCMWSSGSITQSQWHHRLDATSPWRISKNHEKSHTLSRLSSYQCALIFWSLFDRLWAPNNAPRGGHSRVPVLFAGLLTLYLDVDFEYLSLRQHNEPNSKVST